MWWALMWLRSKPGGTQVGNGAEGIDSLTLLLKRASSEARLIICTTARESSERERGEIMCAGVGGNGDEGQDAMYFTDEG